MNNFDLPELGYTPLNLRALRKLSGLTQVNVAEILDVKVVTIARWETGLGNKNHSDMPLSKWIELLSYVSKHQ